MSELNTVLSIPMQVSLFNSKDRFDYEFFFAVRDLINNRDNSLSCFKQALKSF